MNKVTNNMDMDVNLNYLISQENGTLNLQSSRMKYVYKHNLNFLVPTQNVKKNKNIYTPK